MGQVSTSNSPCLAECLRTDAASDMLGLALLAVAALIYPALQRTRRRASCTEDQRGVNEPPLPVRQNAQRDCEPQWSRMRKPSMLSRNASLDIGKPPTQS